VRELGLLALGGRTVVSAVLVAVVAEVVLVPGSPVWFSFFALPRQPVNSTVISAKASSKLLHFLSIKKLPFQQ